MSNSERQVQDTGPQISELDRFHTESEIQIHQDLNPSRIQPPAPIEMQAQTQLQPQPSLILNETLHINSNLVASSGFPHPSSIPVVSADSVISIRPHSSSSSPALILPSATSIAPGPPPGPAPVTVPVITHAIPPFNSSSTSSNSTISTPPLPLPTRSFSEGALPSSQHPYADASSSSSLSSFPPTHDLSSSSSSSSSSAFSSSSGPSSSSASATLHSPTSSDLPSRFLTRKALYAVGDKANRILNSSSVMKFGIETTAGLVNKVIPTSAKNFTVGHWQSYGDPLLNKIDAKVDVIADAIQNTAIYGYAMGGGAGQPQTQPTSGQMGAGAYGPSSSPSASSIIRRSIDMEDELQLLALDRSSGKKLYNMYWERLKEKFVASHWYTRVDEILLQNPVVVGFTQKMVRPAETFYSTITEEFVSHATQDEFLTALKQRVGPVWDDRLAPLAKGFYSTAKAVSALVGAGKFVGGALQLGKAKVNHAIDDLLAQWDKVLGLADDTMDKWLPEKEKPLLLHNNSSNSDEQRRRRRRRKKKHGKHRSRRSSSRRKAHGAGAGAGRSSSSGSKGKSDSEDSLSSGRSYSSGNNSSTGSTGSSLSSSEGTSSSDSLPHTTVRPVDDMSEDTDDDDIYDEEGEDVSTDEDEDVDDPSHTSLFKMEMEDKHRAEQAAAAADAATAATKRSNGSQSNPPDSCCSRRSSHHHHHHHIRGVTFPNHYGNEDESDSSYSSSRSASVKNKKRTNEHLSQYEDADQLLNSDEDHIGMGNGETLCEEDEENEDGTGGGGAGGDTELSLARLDLNTADRRYSRSGRVLVTKFGKRLRQRIPSLSLTIPSMRDVSENVGVWADELRSQLSEQSWFKQVDDILLQNALVKALANFVQPAEHFFNTSLQLFQSNKQVRLVRALELKKQATLPPIPTLANGNGHHDPLDGASNGNGNGNVNGYGNGMNEHHHENGSGSVDANDVSDGSSSASSSSSAEDPANRLHAVVVEEFVVNLRKALGASWDDRLVQPAKSFFQFAIQAKPKPTAEQAKPSA